LVKLAEEDKKIVALTAAMPDGTGLVEFRNKFPDRYFDVGICESAAVDIAGGLAKAGLKPVGAIFSTFLQRAFDQIWQEVVLQELPVVFGIDRAGLVGSDGAVHHGFCDLSFLRSMPNMICCAPADELELQEALKFALASGRPVAIRYPRDIVSEPIVPTQAYELGKARVVREGRDATIVVFGALMNQAFDAARMLSCEGIEVSIVSARFAKPLDEALFGELLKQGKPVILAEDHSKIGGFGSAIFEMAQANGLPVKNIVHLGIPGDELIPHGGRSWQLAKVGLDAVGMAGAVREALKNDSGTLRLSSENRPLRIAK